MKVNKRESGKKITLWGGAGLAIGVFCGWVICLFNLLRIRFTKIVEPCRLPFYRKGILLSQLMIIVNVFRYLSQP